MWLYALPAPVALPAHVHHPQGMLSGIARAAFSTGSFLSAASSHGRTQPLR